MLGSQLGVDGRLRVGYIHHELPHEGIGMGPAGLELPRSISDAGDDKDIDGDGCGKPCHRDHYQTASTEWLTHPELYEFID